MDKKDEIISNGEFSEQLDSGIQALADMVDKMGEDNPEPESSLSFYISRESRTKHTKYQQPNRRFAQ